MAYKLLLVEDDKQIREIIVDYFTDIQRENPFEVFTAKDGWISEEKLDEREYDLIFLDVMLPGIDGFSLCRKIRKHSDVPVIFLTARTMEEDILLGFETGCDDYITKPFSLKTLYAKAIAEQMQLFQGSGEYSGSIKPSPFEDGNLISYTSFNLGEGHEDLAYHYIAVIPHTFRTFFPVYRIMAIVFFALFSGIALLVSVIRYRNLLYFYRNEDFRKTLMNSMAHDLKTPLAVMSGYAQNLKENVQTDKREHYAGAIEENVEYMNSLIADILALSRMEENMLHPHKEKVDFCEMMREIATQYDISLQEKNLTFSSEGKFVKNADPARMKRALENLFTNALKYTEEGGQIKVTVSTVPFNGYFEIRNAPAKEVSVKTKKLWEPFVKGDDSRSDKTGTGVGLAITGNILSLHHMKGRIVCKDGSFAVRLSACHF